MRFGLIALIAYTCQAVTLNQKAPCTEPLEISKEQLAIELDYFSRSFDIEHYNNAMKIKAGLAKAGIEAPKMTVHSYELYDSAFSFPRVRRYDLVMQGMDLLQHFQDNLNQNFENSKHVADFIKVGK